MANRDTKPTVAAPWPRIGRRFRVLSLGPRKEHNEEGPYVFLENGSRIPVVNTTLGTPRRFLVEKMLVVEGLVENKWASVLRDSGCNPIVVHRGLVPGGNLTGTTRPVVFLDPVKYLPGTEIFINTPYFTVTVKAKCTDNPLYDLVLGNAHSVRHVEDPDLLTASGRNAHYCPKVCEPVNA